MSLPTPMASVSKLARRTSRQPSATTGRLMVLVGASFWGLSGTVAQILFASYHVRPGTLVAERLILAGGLLLMMEFIRGNARPVVEIWRESSARRDLIVFGMLGMLGVQLTYFLAIRHGNAATATLLQYLGPVVLIVYTSWRSWKIPTAPQMTATALAILGTALLVTNGTFTSLTVSRSGVVWGVSSAVALAFYTLFPRQLLKTYGASVVTGWGMLIGGMGASVYYHPWAHLESLMSLQVDLLTLFVVIFGTFFAFYLYMDSLRLISPAQASLLSCAEPLSAALVSIVWLHVHMGMVGVIGATCIIGAVVVLSLTK
ncbi:Threonine/homoserine efflux transporter RhtA [Sulfobacillus thermosulfidooxidans DSM 9293]|uniref:Threonine/homoserine efflux transporter RhtA n=1 Tax=Sulfobacillus thermosulfidooxidans (strain DSM 9293 / VKM B-1269 / AT-1) TaxID=929705 RepID=A0A1W1WPW3_SULTA|nr:DMT family transporter [Sulfobacillus thermosulfidooxidans]SMC08249.1 Threonine/homoserine efflux transporter RhtA [Sulfobacillus thermosulfidooxidans DSM 9293]